MTDAPDNDTPLKQELLRLDILLRRTTNRILNQKGKRTMFQIIDSQNGNRVVSEHPTYRKAFNASRKLESELSARDGFGNPDWRYLIRKQPPRHLRACSASNSAKCLQRR